MDKSREFSYKELADATNNFSVANRIGEGGFGTVYYAELSGEVRNLILSFNYMYMYLKRKFECSFNFMRSFQLMIHLSCCFTYSS